MKYKPPVNSNYCATVVKIKKIIKLENCDNIQGTIIFGNHVIISKDTPLDQKGLYFPAETQLLDSFLKFNNLYHKPELNDDSTKKGYIDKNGRIRAVKFRGHQSNGLFLPIDCLTYLGFFDEEFNEGDTFDYLNNEMICQKYVTPSKQQAQPGTKKGRKTDRESKIIEGQFHFHKDTEQLGKNIFKLNPNDYISITYKIHGTSFIVSKVLCKRKLNIFEKFLKFCGVAIIDKDYDNLYSSRKVIKNEFLETKDLLKKQNQHFYSEDIWSSVNKDLQEYLIDGLTIYGEIVGFLPTTGGYIQKKYDYGCAPRTYKFYIYRITFTNPSGHIFEFSSKQIKSWCEKHDLNYVHELFYGQVKEIYSGDENTNFHEELLNVLKEKYLEQDCYMCKNKVPAEGIVIRKDTMQFEAYKLKSFRFLEQETKLMDKGESDMENDN